MNVRLKLLPALIIGLVLTTLPPAELRSQSADSNAVRDVSSAIATWRTLGDVPNRDFNHNGRFDIADVIYILNDRVTLKALIENGNKVTAGDIELKGYVNPFARSSDFSVIVPPGDKRSVLVSIYDTKLNFILNVLNKKLEPGQHNIHLDFLDSNGNKLESGVYYLRLQSYNVDIVDKFIVLN